MIQEERHQLADFNRVFLLGILLNAVYIVVEVVFGVVSRSMALLADAGHNLSDVLGLLLAWGAFLLMQRPPTRRRTYGWRKISILAALFNSLVLLVAVGGVGWEAIRRLGSPVRVNGGTVSLIAGLGFVINAATALLFRRGQKKDLNIRGAFLHMLADAALSVGVVGAGLGMKWLGWLWLDPVLGLVIMVLIMAGTWGLLRDSFNLAVDAVPRHIDAEAIERYLAALPGVTAVHDLHVWGMSTSDAALTVHLVVENKQLDNEFTFAVHKELSARFGIHHVTIQLEQCAVLPNCETSCGADGFSS